MNLLVLMCLFGICFARNYPTRRRATCQRSSDCTSRRAPCCRDNNGRPLGVEQEGIFEGLQRSKNRFYPATTPFTDEYDPTNKQKLYSLVPRNGTCSSLLGGEGAACHGPCGCKKGYTCYRPLTGVCCAAFSCYNATWVEEQKRYWENCIIQPNCSLPGGTKPIGGLLNDLK